MKIKDLEKNIKQESDNFNVPDVYHKVKKTPIRSFFKGQTPSKFFNKRAVIFMLSFLMITVIILSVLLFAIFSGKNTVPEKSYSVVNISVESGGVISSYVLICDSDNDLLGGINLTTDKKLNNLSTSKVLDYASTLLPKHENDAITVCVQSTSKTEFGMKLFENIINSVVGAYDGLNYTCSTKNMCNEAKINSIAYVNSKLGAGTIDLDDNTYTICEKYLEIINLL